MTTIESDAREYDAWRANAGLADTLPDASSAWWTAERLARRAQARAIIGSLQAEYEDGARQYESWKEAEDIERLQDAVPTAGTTVLF